MSDERIDTLMRECDGDSDGKVDYSEFVDALARDTVAPAAMGKRGMQSKEAMGVDAQEMLAEQLGHGKMKKFIPTINQRKSEAPAAPAAPAAAVRGPAAAPAERKFDPDAEFARRQKLKNAIAMAEEGMNSRFTDMFKAFQYIDLDRSGRLSKKEISRALDLWNVPLDDDMLDIHPAFAVEDGDILIRKERASAFHSTPLVAHLTRLGVSSLIVCGESTSGCVRASVVDGYSYGYHMTVAEECVFDRSQTTHKINLFDMHHKYADVMVLEDIIHHLEHMVQTQKLALQVIRHQHILKYIYLVMKLLVQI